VVVHRVCNSNINIRIFLSDYLYTIRKQNTLHEKTTAGLYFFVVEKAVATTNIIIDICPMYVLIHPSSCICLAKITSVRSVYEQR